MNLKAKTAWQRVKLLISIAHPDFRSELEEAAQKVNLITRGTVYPGYSGQETDMGSNA